MKSVILKILFYFIIVSGIVPIQAQTSLPTFWDCTSGTLPVGWTTNITSYYTSASYTHSAPNAIKFDDTGIYLTINFVDEPDTLIYYLRGASFSGGTFTVEQSVNGIAWIPVRTFTIANIPNSSLANATPFKDLLSADSRFVRFIYTIKSSGNVAVDDIGVTLKPAGPEANIKIKYNDVFIPSGGMAITGNASTIQFRVFNSGTDSALRLMSGIFSGTNASMFSQTDIPINIGANDSADITINFSPSGADGTKTATLSIANNDTDKNPYIINMWAVKGCCATEPTNPAANLNFSYVKSFKFRVNFSDGATIPDKYIVLKKSTPITEEPIDGQTYLKGDYIGDAQVCYVSASGYFYPANVVANTHYYIKIFAVNGYSGYENYLTSSVAALDTTTLENMIGNYYDGINIFSPTLWQDLHTLINNHYTLYYSDYDTYLINNFESRDTVLGGQSKKTLTCAYSGENYVYTEPLAFTYFSREHNFCQSWMPTNNDANYTDLPEYSDYHNLMPVNQNKVNVYRLNYPLGKVDSVLYQYLDCKKGLDSLGHLVFEPRDYIKGDAARAMFYQILCYDGVNSNDWYLPVVIDSATMYGQSESLLKKWNQQDSPDNWEIARNDYINSVQGNRNPFIDHPEWVDWFGFGVNSVVAENNASYKIFVFPNPSNEKITLITGQLSDASFELYNQSGIKVFSASINCSYTNTTFDISLISPGMYFYKVVSKGVLYKTSKLVLLSD